MGTNFYWADAKSMELDTMDPAWHIGKRSAAGPYCWDCGITLCKTGNEGVHKSKSTFYNECPKCGEKPRKEGFNGSGGLELGFAQVKDLGVSGVCSASSFSYAQNPDDVERALREHKAVVDEYGRKYSARRFRKEVLDMCPIKYTTNVGRWFS
jgi:hypothetical protein